MGRCSYGTDQSPTNSSVYILGVVDKGQSGQPGIKRQNINAIYFSREFSFNQILCDAHFSALNIYFSACAFRKSYNRKNWPKINA
jgi:hypothetical protein